MSGYEANYRGSGRWVPCRLVKELVNGTLEVIYEDGERDCLEFSDQIRPRKWENSHQANEKPAVSIQKLEPAAITRTSRRRSKTRESLPDIQAIEQGLLKNDEDRHSLICLLQSFQTDIANALLQPDQMKNVRSTSACPPEQQVNRTNAAPTRRCSILKSTVTAPVVSSIHAIDNQLAIGGLAGGGDQKSLERRVHYEVSEKDPKIDQLMKEAQRYKQINTEMHRDLADMAEQLSQVVAEVHVMKEHQEQLGKQLRAQGAQILRLTVGR